MLASGALVLACGDGSDQAWPGTGGSTAHSTGGSSGTAADTTDEGSATAGAETGESDPVETVEVPAQLDQWPVMAECFSGQATDMVSVSPEGWLWMADGASWRVLDPLGGETNQAFELNANALHGWGRDRAFVTDGGKLWDVEGQWPIAVASPEGWEKVERFCGDPTSDGNGFVAAAGLHQRDGGQWWEWTAPDGASFSGIEWFAHNGSTCVGREGEAWFGTASGETWRVSPAWARRVSTLDRATAAAFVDGDGVGAVIDGALLIGDPETGFRYYSFAAGPATEVDAGNETWWVVVGDVLLRMEAGVWSSVELDGEPVTLTRVLADGTGGVWVAGDGQVCHLHQTPPIRLEGIHNLARVSDPIVAFTLEGPADAAPNVSMDGNDVSVVPQGDHRWTVSDLELDPGWHGIELRWMTDGADYNRTVAVQRRGFEDLTWVDDIQPLFVEHCGGAACHGPGPDGAGRPDLSTYEAWVARKGAILDRVVAKGNMPPVADRKPTWAVSTAVMISEWFSAGATEGGI